MYRKNLMALLLALLLLLTPALAEMTGERPDGAFLEDAGGELLETMRTLMADETFAAALTASEELAAQIMAWRRAWTPNRSIRASIPTRNWTRRFPA